MRMHAKVANHVGPCPLCSRQVKIDTRGKSWAHKCPHGSKCQGQIKLGLPDVPLCTQCNENQGKCDVG